MAVRGQLREYPGMLGISVRARDEFGLVMREGYRARRFRWGGSDELLAWGTGLQDTYALIDGNLWWSTRPSEAGWRTARMQDPLRGPAGGWDHELRDVCSLPGVLCAPGTRTLVFRTERDEFVDLAVLDVVKGELSIVLEQTVREAAGYGLVAACSKRGEVCLLDDALKMRWRREVPDVASVKVVSRPPDLFVYAVGPERRALFDARDGSLIWEIQAHGIGLCGESHGRIWEYERTSGDLLGRDIGTGEIRHRWTAGVTPKSGWPVVGWGTHIVECAGPLNLIRIRDPESGDVVQQLQVPEPHVLWTQFAPIAFGDELVLMSAHGRDGYHGSLYGLIRLSEGAPDGGGITIEPRPPHRFEKFATGKGTHGYRIAVRCKDKEELVRVGLLLVKFIAYDKGQSAWKNGERGFDGIIHLAFDPALVDPGASQLVDVWTQLWTEELDGIVSAPKGRKGIQISRVDFTADMLEPSR